MEVTILNKQSNNIQDIFLNNARKTKTTVITTARRATEAA